MKADVPLSFPYLGAGVPLALDVVGPAVLRVPPDEAALAVARVQRARVHLRRRRDRLVVAPGRL